MLKNMVKVGISEAKISDNPDDTLATYALGSCIGICFYDPVRQIGGMLHYLLPDSGEYPGVAEMHPFKFADTGIAFLLEQIQSLGAERKRIQVKIAGGASVLNVKIERFEVGKRNYLAARKVLWKNSMFIHGEETGGSRPRTMYLDISDGMVTIKSGRTKKTL